MAALTIVEEYDDDVRQRYLVNFYGLNRIDVYVEGDVPEPMRFWSFLPYLSYRMPEVARMTVAVGVEVIPAERLRVKKLQLCVGNSCLIYHLDLNQPLPMELISFLNNPLFLFVGFDIELKRQLLIEQWGPMMENWRDIRTIRGLGMETFKYTTPDDFMAYLAARFLNLDGIAPREIQYSNWDNRRLTRDQVMYACHDAFMFGEIGRMFA